MAIKVVARDHLKPECREAAFKLVKELVELTRTEKGNISYQYCRDIKDPDFFAMIECWESQEALKTHMESEHFKRIIPQLSEMTSEPSRIDVYEEFI